MSEDWRPVDGYEEMYEVSNFGNVRYRQSKEPRKQYTNTYGYKYVTFCRNGKIKCFRTNRLVAKAFLVGEGVVNHKDGDKNNNHLGNLEYASQRENVSHGFRNNGKKKCAFKVPNGKWITRVYHNGKKINLGTYETEEEAHQVYLKYLSDNNIENRYATCL